mmetsp:Transcript_96843/g.269324  ORF Transcript_96843/g.269324 Transcript_96843/m.269324 type:complete len:218 (+) Transcript_96843:1387-2040(+)
MLVPERARGCQHSPLQVLQVGHVLGAQAPAPGPPRSAPRVAEGPQVHAPRRARPEQGAPLLVVGKHPSVFAPTSDPPVEVLRLHEDKLTLPPSRQCLGVLAGCPPHRHSALGDDFQAAEALGLVLGHCQVHGAAQAVGCAVNWLCDFGGALNALHVRYHPARLIGQLYPAIHGNLAADDPPAPALLALELATRVRLHTDRGGRGDDLVDAVQALPRR